MSITEAVNHPSHYNSGKIEVIDFIDDQKLNFARGSAIKYICRAGKKLNEIEDLRKAVWYLEHEIKILTDELTGKIYTIPGVDSSKETKEHPGYIIAEVPLRGEYVITEEHERGERD